MYTYIRAHILGCKVDIIIGNSQMVYRVVVLIKTFGRTSFTIGGRYSFSSILICEIGRETNAYVDLIVRRSGALQADSRRGWLAFTNIAPRTLRRSRTTDTNVGKRYLRFFDRPDLPSPRYSFEHYILSLAPIIASTGG